MIFSSCLFFFDHPFPFSDHHTKSFVLLMKHKILLSWPNTKIWSEMEFTEWESSSSLKQRERMWNYDAEMELLESEEFQGFKTILYSQKLICTKYNILDHISSLAYIICYRTPWCGLVTCRSSFSWFSGYLNNCKLWFWIKFFADNKQQPCDWTKRPGYHQKKTGLEILVIPLWGTALEKWYLNGF